ncbi:MAG: glycosyltransferase 87 family protein [Corynebacterium sp.]|nr:glycosyltransferase 87 family protein [Corynebacterium sp.]
MSAKRLSGATALFLTAAVFAAWMIYRIFQFPGRHALVWEIPIDLNIYALAGAEVAQGGLLYDAPYIGDLPFTYPPFAGVVFTFLADLSKNWILTLWQVGTAVALALVYVLVFRERGYRLTPLAWLISIALTIATTAFYPFQGTLHFGQINVFLMLLVALDFLPRHRLPGIGIGLAAGLKLTPAYLGLVLLLQKRLGAALGSVLTFLATVAIGWWVVPDAKTFWTDAMFNSSRVGEHSNPGAQSLRSILERNFDISGGWPWLLMVIFIFALTVLAVLVALRRGNATVAMSMAGISSCLVSPFSWFHHWMWVAPLALAVILWSNEKLHALLSPRLGLAGRQLVGFLSFWPGVLVCLPFIARVVLPVELYESIKALPTHDLWFTGAGVLYLAAYGIIGTLVPHHATGQHAASPNGRRDPRHGLAARRKLRG